MRVVLPVLSLLGLLVIITAASFLPEKRLWGVNHLAYYPVPIRIAALLVMAVAFVPPLGRGVYASLIRVHGFFRSHRRAASALVVAAAISSIFIFGAFQTSTLLLGDGEVVSNNLDMVFKADSATVWKAIGSIHRSEPTSRGTTTLYYLSGVLQKRLFDTAATDALRMLGCLLGGVFVFLVLTVFRSSLAAPLAVWVPVLAFSSGALLLFSGYVENYAPLFLVGVTYVIAGLRVIHGKSPLWTPVAAFVLAVYLHVSGMLLGVSLVFLLVRRVLRGEKWLRVLTPTMIGLTVATVFVAGIFTRLGEYFLPLLPSQSTYAVLSPSHWIDIANELLLLIPALPLLLVLGALLWRKRGTSEIGDEPPGADADMPTDGRTPWLTRRDEWHFTTLILVPALIYLLFFNPVIGMARDWDLFAVVLFGLLPLFLLVWNRVLAEGWVRPHWIVAPAWIISAVMTLAWIGVNAAPDRSTERFEHILAYQEGRRDYAYEVLAKTYHGQGRLADAIRIQETAVSISGNPRHHLMLAGYYREYGDIAASVQILERIVERRPEYRPARRELLVALFNHGRFEEVTAVARAGLAYHPSDAFYYYYVGRGLVRLGRIEEGRAALLESQRLRPGPLLTRAIAEELSRLQRGD